MLDEEEITQATKWAFRKAMSWLVVIPTLYSIFTAYISLTRPEPTSIINIIHVVTGEALFIGTLAINFLRTFYNTLDEDPEADLLDVMEAAQQSYKTSKSKYNPKREPPSWVKTLFKFFGFWSNANKKPEVIPVSVT